MLLYVVVSEKAPLRPVCALGTSPKGRGKAASDRGQFEPVTLAIDPHLWGVTRAACRRRQFEPVILVVDLRHWVSPGSLQLNSLGKENVPFVGRGHAPADCVRFPLHLPSSTAPKPSPSGEGGTAIAVTDEGCSVKVTASSGQG